MRLLWESEYPQTYYIGLHIRLNFFSFRYSLLEMYCYSKKGNENVFDWSHHYLRQKLFYLHQGLQVDVSATGRIVEVFSSSLYPLGMPILFVVALSAKIESHGVTGNVHGIRVVNWNI